MRPRLSRWPTPPSTPRWRALPINAKGAGPVVAIDEAHFNFHTRSGRYLALARLLESDGYRVRSNTVPFARGTLDSLDVLIIANAIGGAWDAGSYARPGFTEAEADAVRDWVIRGGSLLLVADHAPMGVAAENLARRFGVTMSKGFTEDPTAFFPGGGPSLLLFSRANGLLKDHAITRGRDASEGGRQRGRLYRPVAGRAARRGGDSGAERQCHRPSTAHS